MGPTHLPQKGPCGVVGCRAGSEFIMVDTTLMDYLRKRGMLVLLSETYSEIEQRQLRVNGETICAECGKTYGEHPYVENCLDLEGRPYLHALCDGTIAKL